MREKQRCRRRRHKLRNSKTYGRKMNNQQCGLYLAPSSIPSAGLGIFAGRDFATGSRIGGSTIGIPVTDPTGIYNADELIAEFGWNSASVGGFAEADFGDVFTILMGGSGAMLTNFHPTLGNVLPGGLSDASYHGDRDRGSPGTGAFTSYDNFTFVAKVDIDAGQEILASVHDEWYDFLREKKPGIFVPNKADYERADQLIQSLADFRHRHSHQDNDGVSDAQFLDMLLRIKTEMLSSRPNSQDANVVKLLPSSLSDFNVASEKGTARSQLNERSLDWLEQNGRCLDDTIVSGTSAIAGAGRGAFAKRLIAEGSIITTLPLVPVMNNSTLDIDVKYTRERHNTKISNRQLLINYCFGHRKSEMLLCPTTAAALVNHNKDRANAKIRWSDFPNSNMYDNDNNEKPIPPYMFSLGAIDPKKMGTDAKLVFDLIATKDIEEGDEIYLDYSEEWEEAWDRHLHSFQPSPTDDYVPASVMNSEERPILLSNDTRLVHHTYLCRLEPFAREDSMKSMPVEDYRANPSMEPDGWGDYTRKMYADNDYMWWWPCDVVGTGVDADGSPIYQTVVFEKGSTDGREPRVIRKLKNVPSSGIKFVNKRYRSDQHLLSAFRHYIPIPDDVFPLHWRNDYKTAASQRLGNKNFGHEEHSKADDDTYERSLRESKCGVWCAPSNIKGAGNGIFLGVDTPGSGYVLGTTFPIIPVSDITQREHWDAADYTWSSSSFETEFETGYAGTNQIQSVNAGSLANFHPGLVNYQTGDAHYKPILDRRKDPGAGAFSDYTGFSFTSRYEIGKGEEVYISYGESWFASRSYLGMIPLSANYNEANRVVASLVSSTNAEEAGGASGLDQDLATEFLSIIKEDVISNPRTRKVLEPYEEYQAIQKKVLARNGTAEATTENKSQEWLEENGYCIDNIYSKRSTIEQAGLGAFARRQMKKGEVITPAPLIATYGRHMFNLVGNHVPNGTNKVNLALNYQFSHKDSSLHLFPTTSALLINHRSNRHWMGPKPNAELKWSTTDKKSTYFLQRSLEDLKKEHYTTLVIDIVATRDIEPDEEITIDYGDSWSDAWEIHVKNFESSCQSTDVNTPCFKSSKLVNEMNDDKFNVAHQAWSNEHFTVCRRSEMPSTDDAVIFIVPRHQTKDRPYDTKNEATQIDEDGNEYRWSFRGIEFDHDGFELASTPSDWYPCLVLDSSKVDDTLDVAYFTFETSTVDDEEANVLRRNRMLRSEDIKFLNKPYKSDMYWEGAFRHAIEIPDSIFPPLWKDLR